MESDPVLQQMPNPYRPIQPQTNQSIHHGPPHLSHHTLASQSGLDLTDLDEGDSVFHTDLHRLQAGSHGQLFHASNGFEHNREARRIHPQGTGSPHTPQQHSAAAQFSILTPGQAQHNSISRLQHDDAVFGSPDGSDQHSTGHQTDPQRLVPNPPDLQHWREKLFNVDETIVLSEEQFHTYFPHVDNVYSHRSTQRYKRKPFVSHYWDCRLKGRPPGTPKSDDPNKKKRKRTARERDLCDVKIKITEYFPGAMLQPDFVPDGVDSGPNPNFFAQASGISQQQQFGVLTANQGVPDNHPGRRGERYYTLQRVNGNGGNGKGDGVAGPHKHTLDYSDKVKKNTIQRTLMKREKEDKKVQKTYHKKASGTALVTVKRHAKDNELKLYGSCFCPFVQRVWISLEAKGIPYQYIEVDPYKKPQPLLDINPRGLVPGIRHGDWGCGESMVIMEYLEELDIGMALLPVGDAKLRANCRFWSDHINRMIVPLFYELLQAQDFSKQFEKSAKLKDEIKKMVLASDPQGPFFLGSNLSYVDVVIAPWILRFSRVMKHYRSWQDQELGSRWADWVKAIEDNDHIKATTSSDDLYMDSYARYAENRPNTSELADAINGGLRLP